MKGGTNRSNKCCHMYPTSGYLLEANYISRKILCTRRGMKNISYLFLSVKINSAWIFQLNKNSNGDDSTLSSEKNQIKTKT